MIKNEDVINRAIWAANYIKDFNTRYSFDPLSVLSGGRAFPDAPEKSENLYNACHNYIDSIGEAYKTLETAMKKSI